MDTKGKSPWICCVLHTSGSEHVEMSHMWGIFINVEIQPNEGSGRSCFPLD